MDHYEVFNIMFSFVINRFYYIVGIDTENIRKTHRGELNEKIELGIEAQILLERKIKRGRPSRTMY